jgi:hypothetical protein
MKEYAMALCAFHDALNICTDDGLKTWITSKIAECRSFSKDNVEKNHGKAASDDLPVQVDIQHYFGRFDADWRTE